VTGERANAGRLWNGLAPALGLAALACFLFENRSVGPQFDDAYISYRYARNLVEGSGLVFNPGEYVEGFSNFLSTLLVAAGMGIGFTAKTAGHLLGVVGGCGTLLATWSIARAGLRPEQSLWAAVAVWIVLASPDFARWASSGMETLLFTAAVAAAFAAQVRGRRGWAAFAAVLANLIRPEGALVAAAVFGFPLLETRFRDIRAWIGPLAWAAVLIALTVFRIAYYGDPLPNTFYAKVGGVFYDVSAVFAAFFLLGNAGLCALPAITAVSSDRRLWPTAAFVVAMLAYGVSIGSGARYLLPVLPLLAALGVCGAAKLFDRSVLGAVGGVLVPALCIHLSFFGFSVPMPDGRPSVIERASRNHEVARDRALDAKNEKLAAIRAGVLLERGATDVLVATGAIGAFGYFSRLPILDIMGLVNTTIARSPESRATPEFAFPGHQRSNPDYVFFRKPAYILIDRSGSKVFGDLVTAPNELREHPDLERHYVWDAEALGYRRAH